MPQPIKDMMIDFEKKIALMIDERTASHECNVHHMPQACNFVPHYKDLVNQAHDEYWRSMEIVNTLLEGR
jgi:hypothetical protein